MVNEKKASPSSLTEEDIIYGIKIFMHRLSEEGGKKLFDDLFGEENKRIRSLLSKETRNDLFNNFSIDWLSKQREDKVKEVLNELREKHVECVENVSLERWHERKGKLITITLPGVGSFKERSLSFFVSEKKVVRGSISDKFNQLSFSFNEENEFLEFWVPIMEYMEECGVTPNFENICDYFYSITGLDDIYRLKGRCLYSFVEGRYVYRKIGHLLLFISNPDKDIIFR